MFDRTPCVQECRIFLRQHCQTNWIVLSNFSTVINFFVGDKQYLLPVATLDVFLDKTLSVAALGIPLGAEYDT